MQIVTDVNYISLSAIRVGMLRVMTTAAGQARSGPTRPVTSSDTNNQWRGQDFSCNRRNAIMKGPK